MMMNPDDQPNTRLRKRCGIGHALQSNLLQWLGIIDCCRNIAISLIDGIHDLNQRLLAFRLFSGRVRSYIITGKNEEQP